MSWIKRTAKASAIRAACISPAAWGGSLWATNQESLGAALVGTSLIVVSMELIDHFWMTHEEVRRGDS